LEHLRQLLLKHVEFSHLLLDGVQLLCHELVQVGTHRQTLSAVEFCRPNPANTSFPSMGI
jgi:hypothetical protein